MPFLSRIRINPFREHSRRLLSNPRKMHGAVLGGVPDFSTDERVLWRLDGGGSHRPELVVLTVDAPDWSHLVEQAGWPGAEGRHYTVRDYGPVLEELSEGREFAFRVTANPVQNVPRSDESVSEGAASALPRRQRGRRTGCRTPAAQRGWFLERAQRWGFEVPHSPGEGDGEDAAQRCSPEVRITDRRRHSFPKNGRGPHVVLSTATFEGRLRVLDRNLLASTLLSGIGPGKAYGCGLLTLARPEDTRSGCA
ncbi:type I-E CRISPR-associated protein Cas6/Cse3/CasE [Actinopolyspora mortivallis]|uniref:type I-E CRISPR-associated protein Cas6/Cse3/CasE n=1 Tax=Actinopolyspora mortivallis TaxID=33906 RepID=UPI00036E593B|nr:type I-E CRISPR-associated protein Cas6/Cse3/CasE [Actinopolyspora mortivallis]